MTQGRKPSAMLLKLRAMQVGEVVTLHCPRGDIASNHHKRIRDVIQYARKTADVGFRTEYGADGAVIVARVR